MSEAIVLTAALYLVVFVIAGGETLPLAFGPGYAELDTLVAWLALMWALRMIQSVPGIALMASGDTKPLLIAGIIRACALPLALNAALFGYGVTGIAAAGAAGEFASLVYVANRASRGRPGLDADLLQRTALLVPAGLLGLFIAGTLPRMDHPTVAIVVALATASCLLAIAVLTVPSLQSLVRILRSHGTVEEPAEEPAGG
jgi:O-antigen/teichoic acid export membrane protein